MDSDVKNFESLYRVELMTRAAKDVVAEFVGGGYYLPDLQREFSYSVRQMSQVILSMLRGLSIDAVSFVCQNADHTRYSICDGGHRIVTLQRFFAGEFALDYPRSESSDALSINGRRFTGLSAFDQQRLAMMPLQCVMVYPRAFDKAALREAEIAVFRAKNSCAVRISKASLCSMALAASCDELAEARVWYKQLLKAVAHAVGLSELAGAMLCNQAGSSSALLIAACVLTVECLPGALTETVRADVVADVVRSLGEGYIPRLTHMRGGRMPSISAVTRETSLAFLRAVIPALRGRSMRELRSIYQTQRGVGSINILRFIVESACGVQDWSLLSGRGVKVWGHSHKK
jgi:hypothetical protein